MSIQKEDTKNISFLGRKRINQKDDLFQAYLLDQKDGTANCQIRYDADLIYDNVNIDRAEVDTDLVIDIFVLGQFTRNILPKDHDYFAIMVKDIPDGAKPELRLKIVESEGDTKGRIYAATAKKISFKSPKGDEDGGIGETEQGFLNLQQSEQLNGRLVEVEWRTTQSDICIKVDKFFYQKYRQSPLLKAAIYPDMIRSISLHLLSRLEEISELDDPTNSAYHWKQFIENKLEIPLFGEDRVFDPDEIDTIPEVIEQIVQKFMSSKWYNGKTILEAVLNGN